jgi:hypothetical protein
LYDIIFYDDAQGNCQVEEFITTLDKKAEQRCQDTTKTNYLSTRSTKEIRNSMPRRICKTSSW